MERDKTCLYCNRDFIAKRIDTKFCSSSCRQMSNRRKNDPHTYGQVVPINFELSANEYEEVLERADESEMHPNEFAKDNVLKDRAYHLRAIFTEYEWNNIVNPISIKYGFNAAEKMIHDWVVERAEIELKDYLESG